MTQTLRICVLGRLTIRLGPLTAEPIHFASQRAEVMLAYLAMHPHAHGREAFAAFLWDDRTHKQSLTNLRSLLAQLPAEIKPYIKANRKTIAINTDLPIWVDAQAFETQITNKDIAELAAAIQLYRGDFLEGIYVRESRGLEEWSALTRERFQQVALKAHQQLVHHYLHNRQYTESIHHGRQLLKIDPFHEGALRLVMRVLARDGQRNAALAEYKAFRQLLLDELAVEPTPETAALYERIKLTQLPIPHKVPKSVTPFVGRQEDLAHIEARLDDPHCRLLTLYGYGGVGKTRLALQAAAQRQGEYLNGIYFADLSTAQNVGSVMLVLIQALNIALDGKQPPQTAVLNFLRNRECLIILDNFEHILEDSIDLVQSILKTAPDAQLLITSREQLHLRSEWLYEVQGLAYPPIAPNERWPIIGADAAEQYAAVELFCTCVRRLTQFTPTPEELSASGRICQLVEGSPLAIELAAASTLRYSIGRVAENIGRAVDFLKSKMRDVPARHRSIRAVFDHSWSLMSHTEQQVFIDLAIFRGGLHVAAAEAVAGTNAAVLDNLAAQSLLQSLGDEQYKWHELLRQYAWENLSQEPARLTAVAEKHARYYAGLLQTAEPELTGHGLIEVLEVLDDELESIQTAWQWAIQHQQLTVLNQMTHSFGWLLYIKSIFSAAEEGFRQAAEVVQTAVPLTAETRPLLANLLCWQSAFLRQMNQIDEAKQLLHIITNSLLPHIENNSALHAFVHTQMAECHLFIAEYDAAVTAAERALPFADTAGIAWLTEETHMTLGNVHLDLGRYAEAEQEFQRVLSSVAQSGNQITQMSAQCNIGNVYWYRNELTTALGYFEQARETAEQLGNYELMGIVEGNLGLLRASQGDYDHCLPHMEKAIALTRQLGDQRNEANHLQNLGAILVEMHIFGRAYRTTQRAHQLGIEVNDRQMQAITLDNLGVIESRCFARHDTAETYFQQAIDQYQEIGDELGAAMTHNNIAWSHYLRQQYRAAQTMSAVVLPTAEQSDNDFFLAETLLLHGHIHTELGNYTTAAEVYQRAADIYAEGGNLHLRQESHAGLARLYLRQQLVEQAQAQAILIDQYLAAEGSLYGTYQPLSIYLTCHDVFRAVGDKRAAAYLETAVTTLYHQAELIESALLRHAFLHDIALNQHILDQWEAHRIT